MKKLLIAIALFCIASTAHAQLGVIAGVTSTETTLKDASAKIGDVTQYHFGLALKFDLGLIAVQPALIYNVKGATVTQNLGAITEGTPLSGVGVTTENKTGFLELPIQIQAGLPLPGIRPYVFAEPFVGYAVNNESKQIFNDALGDSKDLSTETNWDNVKNRLEYGLGIGAGIELFDTFQLSVRYFWNLGQMYQEGKSTIDTGTITTSLDTMRDQKSNGIMASLAFFF